MDESRDSPALQVPIRMESSMIVRNHAKTLLILNTRQPQVGRYWGSPPVVEQVSEALKLGGLRVSIASADTREELERHLKSHRPDVVFVNGYRLLDDRDKPYITEVVDSKNIPYVGSNHSAIAIFMSKIRIKEILVRNNIPTPDYAVFRPRHPLLIPKGFSFPAITKLVEGAESEGMARIENLSQFKKSVSGLLEKYDQSVLVEKWSREKEYTVAVLGNGKSRSIMPIEITIPKTFQFLTNEVKEDYFSKTMSLIRDSKKRARIVDLIDDVCSVFNILDLVRIDVLEDKEGNLSVIDINANPGFTMNGKYCSYYPQCVRMNLGMNYVKMINTVVYATLQRSGLAAPSEMLGILQEKAPLLT